MENSEFYRQELDFELIPKEKALEHNQQVINYLKLISESVFYRFLPEDYIYLRDESYFILPKNNNYGTLVYLGSDFKNPKQQKKYVGADRYGLTLALDKFRNYQLYGIPVSIKFGDLLNLPDFKLYLVSGSEARSIFVELPKMAKINVKKCMI